MLLYRESHYAQLHSHLLGYHYAQIMLKLCSNYAGHNLSRPNTPAHAHTHTRTPLFPQQGVLTHACTYLSLCLCTTCILSSTLYVLQPLAFFPLPFPPCFPFPLPISSPSFPPSHLQQSSVAIGPLAIYISGFVTTLILRLLNRVIGRYVSLYHKLYSKNAVRRL